MVYRVCDVCGGVDEHPRHTIAGVIPDQWQPDESLTQTVEDNVKALADAGKLSVGDAMLLGRSFWDTTSTDRHIDCCAQAGCPQAGTTDGCDARVAVWNGRTGAGMVKAAEKVRADNPDHFENTTAPYDDGTRAESVSAETVKG